MEEMEFIWVKGDKSGSFTVTADTVDECIETARKETEEDGAELFDYYSVY